MISKLIENNTIEIYFQPIVSIKDKEIFAFEALTRAFDENGEFISPIYLFKHAIQENTVNTLDSYVRELALQRFIPYYENNKNILLFLNFESSFIESKHYHTFIDVVKKYNINPSNIVLEIKEDEIKDNNAVEKFVDLYRSNNFIIAIDDFGTGYSSFDRLALIKPDIVKVDRSLVYNVNKNFINSEIINAISKMCHRIGALVLAEGVESKKEILTCMSKDIDIFQGFYFAKPLPKVDIKNKVSIFANIKNIGKSYTQDVSDSIYKKQKILNKAEELSQKIQTIYSKQKKNNYNKIAKILDKYNTLEAIYTIEYHNGIQKNDTIINVKKGTLFSPTKDGHDHSLKEYYFIAKNSSRANYLSDLYVSKASGNMCITYSSIVYIHEEKYILCLDIKSS